MPSAQRLAHGFVLGIDLAPGCPGGTGGAKGVARAGGENLNNMPSSPGPEYLRARKPRGQGPRTAATGRSPPDLLQEAKQNKTNPHSTWVCPGPGAPRRKAPLDSKSGGTRGQSSTDTPPDPSTRGGFVLEKFLLVPRAPAPGEGGQACSPA